MSMKKYIYPGIIAALAFTMTASPAHGALPNYVTVKDAHGKLFGDVTGQTNNIRLYGPRVDISQAWVKAHSDETISVALRIPKRANVTTGSQNTHYVLFSSNNGKQEYAATFIAYTEQNQTDIIYGITTKSKNVDGTWGPSETICQDHPSIKYTWTTNKDTITVKIPDVCLPNNNSKYYVAFAEVAHDHRPGATVKDRIDIRKQVQTEGDNS